MFEFTEGRNSRRFQFFDYYEIKFLILFIFVGKLQQKKMLKGIIRIMP